MINVFLDDTRPKPAGYKLARSANDCIRLIRRNKINVLSLDYNLGSGKPTGYNVVQFLIKAKKYPNKIILHTATRSGRVLMYNALKKHKPIRVSLVVRPRRKFIK